MKTKQRKTKIEPRIKYIIERTYILYINWLSLHDSNSFKKFAKPKENKAVKLLIGISILRNGLNSHRPKIIELTEWLPWICLCDFDCIQWSQHVKNSSARLVNYWTEWILIMLIYSNLHSFAITNLPPMGIAVCLNINNRVWLLRLL